MDTHEDADTDCTGAMPARRADCGVPLVASSDGLGLMLGVVVHELVRSATSSCSINSRAVGPPGVPSASEKALDCFNSKSLEVNTTARFCRDTVWQ